MTRIPEIESRDQLPEPQRHVWDEIVASRGSVRGPFKVLLHSPELASRVGALGGYLRYASPLEPAVREATILATASLLDCAYEWAAHLPQARAAGVPEAVLDALRDKRAASLPDAERDLFEFAQQLVQRH